MKTAEFLSRLRSLGISLWPDGEDLRYSASIKGALTPDLRAEIVERKAEILAFLRATRGVADAAVSPAPTGEAGPQPGAPFVAPRAPTEEVLAGIWVEVLGVEQVGVYDDFFELGGDSVPAVQIVSRVRDALRVELPLLTLYETPTVAGLAERIAQARRSGQEWSAPPLVAVARGGEFPLSFAQQRLWFLDQLAPGNPFYNVPTAVRMAGRLDAAALRQSLEEIVRRHEVLRTTFTTAAGQAAQVIAPALTAALPAVDLRELAEGERKVEAWRLATEEARRPFDLMRGPLARATLLRLKEQEHVLLLTMHHIVSDGWSRGVLNREMATLYEAFSEGKPSPLPELPVQYADFAVWQRRWLRGEVLEKQLARWKRRLEGAPAALDLPTDRPRPPVQTFRGARHSLVLPTSLVEALKTLSRREGVTLFMTLLAAFQTLLNRYTGHRDIVVGSPIAGRNRSEIESLIGFFVNTLVLRTELGGDPSFRELLGRVREVTVEAYAHQDLPLETLVEELRPERNLSRNPLFQVMFALQNVPLDALALPGLALSPLTVDSGTAQFDLTLLVTEMERELEASFEYSTDLFDAATIARLGAHLKTLLEDTVAHPDWRLSNFPLLTDAERQQLLAAWNDTGVAYPRPLGLHHLFEIQAARTPEAVAAIFEDQHLVYGALDRRANQLAHHLQSLGVGPEVFVGICMERSLEMLTGLLGVLKAGGAYVPLDPTYPPERLAFLVKDARVQVLLTQRRLAGKLAGCKRQRVDLDAAWAVVAQERETSPHSGMRGDNLAYAIYTSGSTGKPKGVMVAHGAICNTLLRMLDLFEATRLDCGLHKSSLSVDGSVWEMFVPLSVGARLVLADPDRYLDPVYLLRLIQQHQIEMLDFVSSTLQVFLSGPKVKECAASIRRVWCGGEALPFSLKERFLAQVGAMLFHDYGPTEASLSVTYWLCRREDEPHVVPIGRPIGNMQVYLLDAHLRLVPIGVAGEMHVGGVGLARGYLNRPALTADRFVPHPFSAEPGARLYKTGDLACYLPDGNLKFIGRIDHQVKVRSFRVELGEIEATLSQHPAVREDVVVTYQSPTGHTQLAAYVIPRRGPPPTAYELRNFLQARLPEYMVPSAFTFLETFPLLPSGKVDRRVLPPPEGLRPELEAKYVAPRSEMERTIATTWQELLQVEKVGIHDNFFDLGGHSLLMVQVHSKLRTLFAGELLLLDLFKYPTVGALAKHLSEQTSEQFSVRSSHDRAEIRGRSMERQRRFRQKRRAAPSPKG